MKSPAFQIYVNDFLGSAKVGMMSTDEVGAYLLLLFLDWQEGGFEYDPKRLAKWCRLTPSAFRRAWEQVGQCFEERDGRLWNPRLVKEREKQAAWREKAQKGAAKTNENRRNSARPSDRHSEDSPGAERGENGRTPLPLPSQVTATTSGDGEPAKPPPPEFPPDFEAVWAVYPKRAGSNSKKEAHSAWRARIKSGAPTEVLRAGVERYRAFCEAEGKIGSRYVMQASSFFGPADHYLETWEPDRTTSGKQEPAIRVVNGWFA